MPDTQKRRMKTRWNKKEQRPHAVMMLTTPTLASIVLIIMVLMTVTLAANPANAATTQGQFFDPQITVIGLMGDRAILRVDGEQKILRRGESSDGITLTDINSREAVLRVNGHLLRLGMGMDSGGMAARAPGGSVEIIMNSNGQFISNGQINGRVVEFIVDTGANTVSMTADDARTLGIDYRTAGQPATSNTAAGVVRTWLVTLKSIRIGPIEVRNVQASVREAPRITPILLGMSFLSQVNLQHDGNRMKITAR
jgi:aspartyl protease family protein